MKIVLASRNAKKIKELREILSSAISDVEILSLDDVGIYGEIEEDGESFEENAFIKAHTAAKSGYIGVGEIEAREVRISDVKIKHVNDVPAADAVDEIADDARIKQNFRKPRRLAFSENRSALPYYKAQRRKTKHGKRPDMTLEHPPGATAVLHVREIEKTGDHGDCGLRLEKTRRQLFDDSVGEHKIGDGRNRYEREPHFPARSISFWHSMHVSTKG